MRVITSTLSATNLLREERHKNRADNSEEYTALSACAVDPGGQRGLGSPGPLGNQLDPEVGSWIITRKRAEDARLKNRNKKVKRDAGRKGTEYWEKCS